MTTTTSEAGLLGIQTHAVAEANVTFLPLLPRLPLLVPPLPSLPFVSLDKRKADSPPLSIAPPQVKRRRLNYNFQEEARQAAAVSKTGPVTRVSQHQVLEFLMEWFHKQDASSFTVAKACVQQRARVYIVRAFQNAKVPIFNPFFTLNQRIWYSLYYKVSAASSSATAVQTALVLGLHQTMLAIDSKTIKQSTSANVSSSPNPTNGSATPDIAKPDMKMALLKAAANAAASAVLSTNGYPATNVSSNKVLADKVLASKVLPNKVVVKAVKFAATAAAAATTHALPTTPSATSTIDFVNPLSALNMLPTVVPTVLPGKQQQQQQQQQQPRYLWLRPPMVPFLDPIRQSGLLREQNAVSAMFDVMDARMIDAHQTVNLLQTLGKYQSILPMPIAAFQLYTQLLGAKLMPGQHIVASTTQGVGYLRTIFFRLHKTQETVVVTFRFGCNPLVHPSDEISAQEMLVNLVGSRAPLRPVRAPFGHELTEILAETQTIVDLPIRIRSPSDCPGLRFIECPIVLEDEASTCHVLADIVDIQLLTDITPL